MPRPQFHNHPDGLHPNPGSFDWQDRNRKDLPRFRPGDILIRQGLIEYNVSVVVPIRHGSVVHRLEMLKKFDYLTDALDFAVHACPGDRSLYIRDISKAHADEIPF